MIQTILAFCGYTKIPLEAVRLSIAQELYLEGLIIREKNSKELVVMKRFLEGQKILTGFLRSGRLLSYKE